MTSRHRTAELWPLPAPEPVELRLAVIGEVGTLAARATAALNADGLAARLETVGRDLSVLDASERRSHLVLLRHAGDQRELERNLRWVAGRLASAMIVVALPPGTRHDAGSLLSAGADGLVFERDLETALPAAVRAAWAGQVSVPAELRNQIQPPALSHRESQILGLTVAGMTNSQIASRLCISESTVKTHLSAAFRRLGVHSRRQAAALVFGPDEVLRRTVLGTLRLSGTLPRTERG